MKLRYALLAFLIAALTSCTTPSLEEDQTLSENGELESVEVQTSSIENEVLAVVNAHRAELGLSKLKFSSDIYMYAEEHNYYMIANGKISHDNFYVRASSITRKEMAAIVKENVAKNYSSANKVVEAWLKSEEHKKTIEGDFTHTVISIKADERGKLYYTQLFYKI